MTLDVLKDSVMDGFETILKKHIQFIRNIS